MTARGDISPGFRYHRVHPRWSARLVAKLRRPASLFTPCLSAVPALEFIDRFLAHGLPSRFRHVRQYGFLAPKGRETKVKAIRDMLGCPDEDAEALQQSGISSAATRIWKRLTRSRKAIPVRCAAKVKWSVATSGPGRPYRRSWQSRL